MSNGREFSKPAEYQIMVKGNADAGWPSRFDDYTVLPQPNLEILIMGTVNDQPALHGLLGRIRDEGLTLLWLRRQNGEPDKPTGIS